MEESFTKLSFDNASLRHSNLGGQGGRCDESEYPPGQCEVAQTPTTPHEIYITGVGSEPSGSRIDLRIVNETTYRAWRLGHNGIKRGNRAASSFGYFAVVNLLGPRSATQLPAGKWWNEAFTFVQLRYEFLDGAGAPIVIQKTYLTFYDFDTGWSQVIGAVPAVECMQMGPQATAIQLPHDSDIQQLSQADFVASLSEAARAVASTFSTDWSTSNASVVNTASVFGVGDDNPSDSYSLTELQARRSLMAMFEQVLRLAAHTHAMPTHVVRTLSATQRACVAVCVHHQRSFRRWVLCQVSFFQLRYAIDGCCTTGATRPCTPQPTSREELCMLKCHCTGLTAVVSARSTRILQDVTS